MLPATKLRRDKKGLTHTIVSCRNLELDESDRVKRLLELTTVFFDLRNELSDANVQFHFDRLSVANQSIVVSIASAECELFESFLQSRGFGVSVLGETEHVLSPIKPKQAVDVTADIPPSLVPPTPSFISDSALVAAELASAGEHSDQNLDARNL